MPQRDELEPSEVVVRATTPEATGAVRQAVLAGQDLDHQGRAAGLLLEWALAVRRTT